jgi:hypothetical protein
LFGKGLLLFKSIIFGSYLLLVRGFSFPKIPGKLPKHDACQPCDLSYLRKQTIAVEPKSIYLQCWCDLQQSPEQTLEAPFI